MQHDISVWGPEALKYSFFAKFVGHFWIWLANCEDWVFLTNRRHCLNLQPGAPGLDLISDYL
jgi:hypothetical protein